MAPTEGAEQTDLRLYLRILRRRRWVVIGAFAAGLVLAGLYSLSQTRLYSAAAKLRLGIQATRVFDIDAAPYVNPVQLVRTEIEVVNTQPVHDIVRAKIGEAPGVKVAEVGETQFIVIQATHRDRTRAAKVANAYAEGYVEYRRKQAVDELLAASQEIDSKIGDLQSQIDGLAKQVEAAPICVDARSTPEACARRDGIIQSVNSRRTTLVNQQALFRQRLDQLQVDSAVASGGVQIVTPASPPTEPFQPAPRRNAVLGGAFGLLLGIGLAFAVDRLDDTMKRKEDLEAAIPRVPVVGLIPLVPEWKAKERSLLVSVREPQSPAAEAYRILRTSVQFLGLDRDIKIVQVTSPNAREGKTTTLANLAVAFARSGLRTVAVCCDLRRPRLNEFFDLPNQVGFTSVLLGEVPLEQALQAVPGQSQLRVLASGPLPPNPSELLSSRRTAELLNRIAAVADIVLVDSPPTLPVTDALVLSRRVQATLLITLAGTTSRKAASRAVEMLEQINAPLVGVVLNAAHAKGEYGSYPYAYDGPSDRTRASRAAGNGSAGPISPKDGGVNGGRASATSRWARKARSRP